MAARWQIIDTAPKNGCPILVRRHNGVCHEYDVVWWVGNATYPWMGNHTSYPPDRMDEWTSIPGEVAAAYGEERRR
jgi:hypothetical protein